LARLAVVAGALVAYALLFAPLHRSAGAAAAAASGLVVVLAGVLLGQSAGIAVALVCIPLHLLLFAMVGEAFTPGPHTLAGLIFAAVGGTIGRLRDLGQRLRQGHAELERVLAKVKEAQGAVADREAELALAQEMTHVGSWSSSLETGATTWSAELCRILGEAPDVVPTPERWWERIQPDDRVQVQRLAEEALREGQSAFDVEYRIVRPDGSVRWAHGRGKILRDGNGKPVKRMGTVQDVTLHRELQAQLASAERLASLGTLARGMAHEINNPLSYLVTNVRFLSHDLEALAPALPPERAEELAAAAREALQGADRVSRIVRELLVFSQPDEHLGSVEVERVVDLALSMAGRSVRGRAQVVKDYAGVPRVRGDAWQLAQAFRFLLENAVQAIPVGSPTEQEIRIVTRHAGGGRVAVEIRDTGVGMSPEVKGRAFEPFFTTRPEGAGKGMGLSSCLGIVRAAGGDVTVESTPGQGSVFTVVLPIAEPEPDAANG
jgi:PAS domain S-box-containing protein